MDGEIQTHALCILEVNAVFLKAYLHDSIQDLRYMNILLEYN